MKYTKDGNETFQGRISVTTSYDEATKVYEGFFVNFTLYPSANTQYRNPVLDGRKGQIVQISGKISGIKTNTAENGKVYTNVYLRNPTVDLIDGE